MYKLINLNKLDVLKNVINKNYKYNLDSYSFEKLLYSNNSYINKLVCIEIKDKFLNNTHIHNKLNLHRWCLKNKNKTLIEKEYPW